MAVRLSLMQSALHSLLASIYPHILPLLADEATSVAACACVEDILLDMSFSTQSRVDPILDFLASPVVGNVMRQAREGEPIIGLAS